MRISNTLAAFGAFTLSMGSSVFAGSGLEVDPAGSRMQGPIRSDYAPMELTNLCKAAIQEMQNQITGIVNLPKELRSMDSTMLTFETVSANFSDAVQPLIFMASVSMDEEVRKEAQECEEAVMKFSVEYGSRRDLYDALKGQKGRNAEESRLLSETLKGFERNGLMLPDAELAEVTRLKKELSVKEVKFRNNLNEDKSTIELTLAELDGVPDDYVKALKKTADGANYVVTTKESDVGLFLENATHSEARRKWTLAYQNRQATENTKLLEEALALRAEIAKKMGFETWADFRIQGRMASDSKTVLAFLTELRSKLAARNQSDLGELLAFKKTMDPNAKDASVLNPWDINYLKHQMMKSKFTLDQEKIREYFPADTVVRGMFEVYSTLLGVTYKKMTQVQNWAPNVDLYSIHDAKDQHLLGYFYTDFFPREGKYDHAAAFPLIAGREMNGNYTYPVASIVSNLTPPLNGKPSLLSHDDVETIFHEFGHIMHMTLTRAKYASLSGAGVAQDFVEAPSQMLENWVWDPSVLKRLSGHYLDPSQKLPDELLAKMIAARDFNKGYFYTRQLLFGLLDMTYSTSKGPVDVTATYDQLYQSTIGLAPIQGAHFPANFGHLMGGYDAGYYGYLWSEVYATDMFSKFEAGGLLSPEIGGQYRRAVLEQGNMKEGMELLREFLGREPNQDAFLRKLHLEPKAEQDQATDQTDGQDTRAKL